MYSIEYIFTTFITSFRLSCTHAMCVGVLSVVLDALTVYFHTNLVPK